MLTGNLSCIGSIILNLTMVFLLLNMNHNDKTVSCIFSSIGDMSRSRKKPTETHLISMFWYLLGWTNQKNESRLWGFWLVTPWQVCFWNTSAQALPAAWWIEFADHSETKRWLLAWVSCPFREPLFDLFFFSPQFFSILGTWIKLRACIPVKAR